MAEARDLAYSTVTTMLYRLHRKGLAARQLSGRGNAYRLAQDEAAHGPGDARAAWPGHDRDAVLARFLTRLAR